MRKTLILLLIILTLPLFAFAQEEEDSASARQVKPITAAEKAKLVKVLPDPKQVAATAEEIAFYGGDLYKYIDGGSEAYHMYDMTALAHREYKTRDVEVTVDVYDMGNELNAFGIYASERSPDSHFMAIGAEGYIDENILNFLQGQYYVKLSAFSDKQKPEAVMRAFAERISQSIGSGKRMPAVLALLPGENRVARSEKYAKQAPLGHEFLAPAILAAYSFEGKQSTLLISTSETAAQAKQKVEALKNHFLKSGKVAADASLPGAERASNAYEGEMVFFSRGRYMVVCVTPPADATFVRKVAARLSQPEAKP